jgi:hypothetical protein
MIQLQQLYECLVLLCEDLFMMDVIEAIGDLLTILHDHVYKEMHQRTFTDTTFTGRPRIVVDSQELTFLYLNGFNLARMASILKCSTRTIQRRLEEMGLSIRGRYSCFSDNELVSAR